MSSFQCPFCSNFMSVDFGTFAKKYVSFAEYPFESNGDPRNRTPNESCVEIDFYKCPNCEKYSIVANGLGTNVNNISSSLQPKSSAKQFPDYIPEAIRQDYEEACAIVNLSPKASATLSRRCLQGIIRDFWGISKARLIDEINELQNKIPAQQWKVIDGIRRIGNIGAHMEKDINLIVDIDPDEAQKLIKLIEHLLDQWYINRHEQELLYTDIIDIDKAKQSERKKTE
ncbi:hypothetical protein C823_007813 [Eubacterium plexicaudatum ASF492]|uniref:DUF4145 domain-containing protein n=1 Tax=Eubacterium plexicaudatum ASF492 TaxID=1235802 RepID=N1ZZ26_9FIRM|nr:hypothetical protein C823_007813 [Eubacterium plexicaudatum ASF492]